MARTTRRPAAAIGAPPFPASPTPVAVIARAKTMASPLASVTRPETTAPATPRDRSLAPMYPPRTPLAAALPLPSYPPHPPFFFVPFRRVPLLLHVIMFLGAHVDAMSPATPSCPYCRPCRLAARRPWSTGRPPPRGRRHCPGRSPPRNAPPPPAPPSTRRPGPALPPSQPPRAPRPPGPRRPARPAADTPPTPPSSPRASPPPAYPPPPLGRSPSLKPPPDMTLTPPATGEMTLSRRETNDGRILPPARRPISPPRAPAHLTPPLRATTTPAPRHPPRPTPTSLAAPPPRLSPPRRRRGAPPPHAAAPSVPA